ncbi:twin-arginine translocase subunit TatC [Thalassoroseus pseudoceratinae]|uniref:twin-arginine translocase subunit TatC n=1 Tax=Thalassoroseus pseudoceratinae TaxID=2713176 RepID=UPI00141D9936|nr:twin-arginine translocase subunit TatC [Thalassoroseus pseudoceratinae]
MNTQSKDLFDDTAMSFGEHLEILRVHLWKAILGLTVAVVATLFFGNRVISIIRAPIDTALLEHGVTDYVQDDIKEDFDLLAYLEAFFSDEEEQTEEPAEKTAQEIEDEKIARSTIEVVIDARELAGALHEHYPETYPVLPEAKTSEPLTISLRAPEFAQFKDTRDQQHKMVTLTVQEAFLTYVKVSVVAGLLLASPWIFYQLWLFVAAGLYPHERKYVYIYLPLSLGLFLGGAVFCFVLVFPFVLDFLLSFNQWLGVTPQIRLSEWISFALLLPVMFGLSFQLPLVMLFLERISIFTVETYRDKRRMAILVIAIISMFLTPADPMSMMLMMFPLVILYQLGIVMCGVSPKHQSPFEAAS